MNITHRDKHLGKVDFKTLSHSISLIENEVPGYEDLLMKLEPSLTKIIGVTGAPGAGKK